MSNKNRRVRPQRELLSLVCGKCSCWRRGARLARRTALPCSQQQRRRIQTLSSRQLLSLSFHFSVVLPLLSLSLSLCVCRSLSFTEARTAAAAGVADRALVSSLWKKLFFSCSLASSACIFPPSSLSAGPVHGAAVVGVKTSFVFRVFSFTCRHRAG